MNLAARNQESRRSFILLAPQGSNLTPFIGEKTDSDEIHSEFLTQMQRLRGRIYVKDGAVECADLTADHRHVSEVDIDCWHMLTIGAAQQVLGCARFHLHSNSDSFDQLGVRHASIASSEDWGEATRLAVEAELNLARLAEFYYVEVGGWALADELRGTTEALQFALATFAWSQLIGGALGIGTVTERNGSASILRRLGGKSLEWQGTVIPPYFDPRYRCGMELLRFDSRRPNPRFGPTIEMLRVQIAKLPIVRPKQRYVWEDGLGTGFTLAAQLEIKEASVR